MQLNIRISVIGMLAHLQVRHGHLVGKLITGPFHALKYLSECLNHHSRVWVRTQHGVCFTRSWTHTFYTVYHQYTMTVPKPESVDLPNMVYVLPAPDTRNFILYSLVCYVSTKHGVSFPCAWYAYISYCIVTAVSSALFILIRMPPI